MTVPCVTINELTEGIKSAQNETVKKVLIAILNDFMDLQFAKTSPYTTGQTVLPTDTTVEDVDGAASDNTTEQKFIVIFKKISATYKSGDLTPQSRNGDNGTTWDPKLTPVLVVVKPNP